VRERGMTLGLRSLSPWQGRDGPHSQQACCSITAAAVCPSNTRDQLRGAHDLTIAHDERSDDGATIRLRPPFVSCIALFGNAVHLYDRPLSARRNARWPWRIATIRTRSFSTR
jgi:hypothetical protein